MLHQNDHGYSTAPLFGNQNVSSCCSSMHQIQPSYSSVHADPINTFSCHCSRALSSQYHALDFKPGSVICMGCHAQYYWPPDSLGKLKLLECKPKATCRHSVRCAKELQTAHITKPGGGHYCGQGSLCASLRCKSAEIEMPNVQLVPPLALHQTKMERYPVALMQHMPWSSPVT